jgi:hypothetical protein
MLSAQAPLKQDFPAGHWYPHCPQLLLSVCRLASPDGQEETHFPLEQCWSASQVCPQYPQLRASVFVSTQVPPHFVVGAKQYVAAVPWAMVIKATGFVANGSGVAIARFVIFWGERAGIGDTFPVVAAVGPGVTAVTCGVTGLTGVATVVWAAVCTVRTGLATRTGVVETFTGAFVATCRETNPRKNP